MKKIFVLIAFLFSVVCYASPPPDLVPDPVTDQCGYVVQVQDAKNVAVFTVEVQEVAFNYLGNFEMGRYQEFITDGLINNRNYFSNTQYNYCVNKQNSNYGYPFTGDKRRIS